MSSLFCGAGQTKVVPCNAWVLLTVVEMRAGRVSVAPPPLAPPRRHGILAPSLLPSGGRILSA